MKAGPPEPSKPGWPDLDAVAELDKLAPGSGARFLEAYFRALETEDEERRAYMRTMVADASHARVYRHLCLFLGTALASGAIALGAFAVAQGANVYAIAALVAPISGLAGVFVWGGQRPRDNGGTSGRKSRIAADAASTDKDRD